MDTGQLTSQEGQLYKSIRIEEHQFDLYYGYNEEFERESTQPVVIFPDLAENPVYTRSGSPIVTAVQDPCRHYTVPKGKIPEEWCADCIHYPDVHQEIGICSCREFRRQE